MTTVSLLARKRRTRIDGMEADGQAIGTEEEDTDDDVSTSDQHDLDSDT